MTKIRKKEMKNKNLQFYFILISSIFLASCGGGVHSTAGGLEVVKKQRKAGIVVIGGIRHIFDNSVNMGKAWNLAFPLCKTWGFESMELSSAKNTGGSDGENAGAALGTLLGGHSPAGSVEIVYECYNE